MAVNEKIITLVTIRNKIIMFCFVLVSVLCFLINYRMFGRSHRYYRVQDLQNASAMIENQLVKVYKTEKGSGCVMPKLDPFSSDVLPYIRDFPPVICDGQDWVKCYLSECKVVPKILSEMNNVVCDYRDILSTGDFNRRLGKLKRVKGDHMYYLKRSDHVYIECSGRKKHDGYVSILPTTWSGYATGFRAVTPKMPSAGRQKNFNMMIIAFDSTAKNGFIRTMKKSFRVLNKEVNATILNAYNIVGDGTIATLLPILTGRRDLELPDARRGITDVHTDVFPLLFYMLHGDGYRTAYFEDSPWIGSFQQRYNGFKKQPTDHYLYPFLMYESNDGEKWQTTGDQKYCVGDTMTYKMMLNISEQFMSLSGMKFGFTFIADICHDDFNMLAIADDDFTQFLRRFLKNHSEDTLLIVMGDHGPRFGPILSTSQGKLERRLPFMAIRLPDRLVRERPEALRSLKQNAEVLTTPRDIYATLLDVLNLRDHWDLYKLPGVNLTRALTLLSPIPPSRTCSEAGIEPHWCACFTWSRLAPRHPLYTRAAHSLVEYVNDATKSVRSLCALRTLSTIHWVVIHQIKPGVLKYRASKDSDGYIAGFLVNNNETVDVYQVKVTLNPGKAEYEGTLSYYTKQDKFRIKATDISRNDAYGSEPNCISNRYPHLNLFCYCKYYDVKK